MSPPHPGYTRCTSSGRGRSNFDRETSQDHPDETSPQRQDERGGADPAERAESVCVYA